MYGTKYFCDKRTYVCRNDHEGMNIDDQNEKNDFLKSDGTGTENKTSSENERHATYASTDSMYDDPKKNTIVS